MKKTFEDTRLRTLALLHTNEPFMSLNKLDKYLYEILFDKIPDFVEANEVPVTGCSSFVREGKLYRNLDWNYGETIEFRVRFKDIDGMAFIDGITEDNLNEHKFSDLSQLPYRMCDGRNGYGLMVSTHVLFNDFDFNGSGNKDVSLVTLPFLVLTTMNDINVLSDEVKNLISNVKVPDGMKSMGMLIQVLVSNGTITKLFTPTKDGYEYIDISSNPKITNFKWVNRENVTRKDSDIQNRPTGIERWNMININTKLKDLRFSLAYENNERLSEFIGIDGTTKKSSDEELSKIYNRIHDKYIAERKRDNTYWQTVHSVIYNPFRMEELYIQEKYEINYADKSIFLDNVRCECIHDDIKEILHAGLGRFRNTETGKFTNENDPYGVPIEEYTPKNENRVTSTSNYYIPSSNTQHLFDVGASYISYINQEKENKSKPKIDITKDGNPNNDNGENIDNDPAAIADLLNDIIKFSKVSGNTLTSTGKAWTNSKTGRKVYKDYPKLTDAEIKARIDRLKLEHELSDLTNATKYKRSGKERVGRLFSIGGGLLTAAAMILPAFVKKEGNKK